MQRLSRPASRWLAAYSLLLVGAAVLAVDTSSAAVNAQPATRAVKLTRSGSPIALAPTPKTLAECEIHLRALMAADGEKQTTGQWKYECSDTVSIVGTFVPNPPSPAVCTSPKPSVDSRTIQCPAPTVGTWSQTRDYVQGEYPTCGWTPGPWLPAEPAPGICAAPPPPPATTLVYACAEAGADGRVLESASISWPNCRAVSYRQPRRDLIVATNDGGTLTWKLASRVTAGKVWAKTGDSMRWLDTSAITWAAAPAVELGSASLSWVAPTQNVDGSALTDLRGFRILYGTNANALSRVIDVTSPSASSYVVEGLAAATWYFGVKAYTTAGKESAVSNIVSKAIS